MRFTRKVELGLACILNIASKFPRGPINIATISKEEKISKDYVEQILNRLKRAGLIESIRGLKGGYILKRRPKDITIKDIITALEKRAFEIVCFSRNHKNICIHPRGCSIKPIWIELDKRINETLDGINLEDIINAKPGGVR